MKIKNFLTKLTVTVFTGAVQEAPRKKKTERILPRRRLRVFESESMRFYYPLPRPTKDTDPMR